MAFIASSIAPSSRSGNGSAAPFEKSATHPAVACIDKQQIYLSHPILIVRNERERGGVYIGATLHPPGAPHFENMERKQESCSNFKHRAGAEVPLDLKGELPTYVN